MHPMIVLHQARLQRVSRLSGEIDDAADPATTSKKLAKWAYHKDRNVRLAVAANPNISVETAKALLLANQTDEGIVNAVANNLARSYWMLTGMDEGGEVAKLLATLTHDTTLLAQLSQHPEPNVRVSVAYNMDAGLPIWRTLALDPEWEVQAGVLQHPKALRDGDVMAAMVGPSNPHWMYVIDFLAADTDDDGSMFSDLVDHPDDRVAFALMAHPDVRYALSVVDRFYTRHRSDSVRQEARRLLVKWYGEKKVRDLFDTDESDDSEDEDN